MNVIVRLYWQHDLDLVALNMHPDFDMGKWMKKAVIAFAKGDAGFVIPLPRSMPYHANLESCSTHFALAPGKDADIIACLNGFRYGQRNSAIKNIFRMYLEAPYLEPYYNEKMFTVKTRGSAKDTEKEVEKVQISPVVKQKTVSVPVLPVSTSVATEKAIPSEETYAKTNVPVKKAEGKDLSETSFTENNMYTEESVDYAEPEQDSSDDGFDLFGAIGEMMS